MGFLRKLFVHGHGSEHNQGHGGSHRKRYRSDDRHDGNQEWGRHPGSIPAMPPDLICPQCRKSNPPHTRKCRQCDTPLVHTACARCGVNVQAGARYCANCGKRLG